jgi:hypothetical protein
MASYKTNPPLRDADSNPPRRMATHTQPSRGENREYREAEVAHPLGQTDTRRRMQVSQPMGGARPHMRDPPSLRSRPEAQKAPSSSLRFGRPETRPMGPDPPPLRAKSSRNVLRRKPSSIAQTGVPTPAVQSYMPPAPVLAPPTTGRRPSATAMQFTERRPSNDQTLRSAEAYHDIFTRTGPRVPSATQATQPIIPELDRYRSRPEDTVPSRRMELPHKLSTQDLPPPFPTTIVTPVYSGGSSSGQRYSGYSGSGYSVSPSTRFSESPGPGCGAYSRDTTPTSMSSPSPGIYLPVKAVTPRQRQGSASTASNRPPVSSVTRRKGGSISEIDVVASPVDSSGLSVVRESLTSSSSNSTVKGDASAKEKKKKKRLSPLPPSPPPRKSSQKFNKPSPGDFDSPSKASPSPARPLMTSPSESSPARPARPVRPSREGTPDLQSQLGASVTVIQSNLPALSFAQQDRRRSAIPPPLQVQTNLRPQGTRIPSRNPSPGPIPPSPREGTPAPSGLGIVPDLRPPITPALRSSSRGTTPSPSQATRPRFGLFGRRKTEPVIETKEKAPRKGPAAGTGHEGYGKYGVRGRSSSAGGPRARERSLSIASSSQESMASTPATYDPFLLHRMSPVIIAGGGEIIENRNSGSELIRTESSTSLVMDRGRPSVDSRGSSKSNLGHGAERTTLWPSAMPKEPTRRISGVSASKGRRPSDSSDDGFGRSRLALRRSVQRLGDATGVLNLPRPLNIPSTGMSSSMTSLDASLMSDDSQMQTGSGILPHGRKGQLTKPKKLEKRPKSPTKWNFFHRSKPSTKTTAPAMAVTVGKATAKSVPHYALLDSSDEQPDIDPADLEDIMMDAAVVDLSNEELDALQFGSDKFKSGHMDDILVNLSAPLELKPAPIIFSSPEPITPVLPPTELHLVKETAPIRPSRLPQVGRIPKVISARPETTSPKSFSRPFARLSVAQPQPQVVADRQSVALGPSPPKPSTPEPAIPGTSLRQTSGDSKAESASTASHLDFLAFSPRKNSEATTNSSGGLSFVGTTAIIPEPDADLEEDEVWGEYDDLIENDETIRVPGSATSSHGVPFQYESYESRRIRKSKMLPKESPTLTEAPKISHSDERVSHLTSSSVYSQEMSTRLKEALTALPTPTTPLSFTDFISSYRDRNIDSASKPNRSSHNSSRKSGSSSYSSQMSMEEQENPSPRSQVNLRVGSMTVSKWLTFGHVLFSPARDDVDQEGVEKAQSVLVIDGLGNGIPTPIYRCAMKTC